MDTQTEDKIAALVASKSLGCSGAHFVDGKWMPCSSDAELFRLSAKQYGEVKILPSDIEEWSSRRSKKGRRKKKKFEKLRERGVLGIDTLPGGGLVSAPIMTASLHGPDISEKAVIAPYSPRNTDVDVFTNIESARARARQLGCIGVSRRVSRSGQTVWMPCTNMTDYANRAGTTALGRRNIQKRQERQTERAVRTILSQRGLVRKKSLAEELHQYKALGRTIAQGARAATATFDPNAFDGDNDGLVQDSTAFERPKIPSVSAILSGLNPKTAKEFQKLGNWYDSLNEKEKADRFGPPIEAIGEMKIADAMAIASEIPAVGLRSSTKPPTVNNPKATTKNPFAELGGRAMGQIILSKVKPEHQRKDNPTTYFVGGTVGVGKSTVISHLQDIGVMPKSDEAAEIDPDFLKAGLPGYNDGAGAANVHRQSRIVADRVMQDATSAGMDVIIVGTGKRDEHAIGQKRAGHKVVGHFVYAPVQTAEKRLRDRNQAGGRQIRDMSGLIAQQIPYHISRMVDAKALDEFYLWDNSGDISKGQLPKLIAEKKPGKKMVVHDQKMFDDFAGGSTWSKSWEQKLNDNDSLISQDGLRSSVAKESRKTPEVDTPELRLQDSDASWDFNEFGNPNTGLRSSTGKPRFPRKPPFKSLDGKAEDVFGDSEDWADFRKRLKGQDIYVIDYETTGLVFDEFNEPSSNGAPLQIGIVKMRDGKVLDRTNIYMNPGMKMSEWEGWSRDNLKDMNGNPYTDAFFDDKPSIAEAHKMVADFIGPDAIVVMQNAVFDNEVLEDALSANDIDWRPAGIIDTKEIADVAIPKWTPENQDAPFKMKDGQKVPSNGLADITTYLGVDLGENHHSADYDAEATGHVLTRMADMAIKKGWNTDLFDKDRRDAKVRQNQERFNKEVADFKKAKEVWSKDNQIGLRSTSSRFVKRVTPRGRVDRNQPYKTSSQIAIESTPRSYEDLQYVLKTNRFTADRRVGRTRKLIEELGVDWAGQEKATLVIERAIADSPALKAFISKYGMPPVIVTDRGLSDDGYGGLIPGYWGPATAMFNRRDGVLLISPRVLEQKITRVGGEPRTIDYVIRHEIGHAMDSASNTDKNVRKRKVKALSEYMSRVKDWYKSGQEGDQPNEMDEYNLRLAQDISEYAAVNMSEYIAEAFAHLTAPDSEGLRQLREQHFEMLADFLGMTIDEIKSIYISRNDGVFG